MGARLDALLERNTRVWMGASAGAWAGLLRRHGARFSPRRAHLACLVTAAAPLNSLAGWLADRLFAPSQTELPDPIFILGHWRSGTTLLHQLLTLDERCIFPTTWECFAPHLSPFLSEEFAERLPLRIPAKRPFDGVELGWQSPQEDEFALASMGCPSPYEWFAFPRDLAPERAPERFTELARKTAVAPTLRRFIGRMLHRRKRGLCSTQSSAARFVVLKSPTHTFRVDELRRAFPRSRFVRIGRDPYTVFSSSKRLWKRLCDHQGLQQPDFESTAGARALEDHVLDTYSAMQLALQTDLTTWRAEGDGFGERYTEIAYDDIDPTRPGNTPEIVAARLRDLATHLGMDLEGRLPASTEARLLAFLQSHAHFEKNRFPELSEAQRRAIDERWGLPASQSSTSNVSSPAAVSMR